LAESRYDLLVVGGGINGVGIARDAAGRGLKVLLAEKADLAGATSSASTKLIHGGLRYLEFYEFRLVRAALREREVLLRMAPHIIWPLRFVLPHMPELRPAWLIRLGLFMYDHLGGRELLPASQSVDLTRGALAGVLEPSFQRGFAYSDCWVDDARLVVLNALDAHERGAEILTRAEFLRAERTGDHWRAEVGYGGTRRRIAARALVNAAGPWVSEVAQERLGQNAAQTVRLVKGSHIVVPRRFAHENAYIFQNSDRRIVFAIPYEADFTLIGTTDVDYKGDPADVGISGEETAYLCAAANRYMRAKVSERDVVWTYSGVRPLFDDESKSASAATRDYALRLDSSVGGAPLLTVLGGKITTYRRLAEEACGMLAPFFAAPGGAWTAGTALPGGDMPGADFAAFLAAAGARWPWLPKPLCRRLARAYGTRMERLLDGHAGLGELGQDFGGGLREAELVYLRDTEWARTAEDVLWRRSKLGLHAGPDTAKRIEAWFAGN
jgi:glycerol-3-phosphate dehydrogenase